MELKLESNLQHQTIPVNGVATVIQASIQEPAKLSHQNPLLLHNLNGEALDIVRRNANIQDKASKQKVTHYMLSDKIKNLPYWKSHSTLTPLGK